MNDFDYDVLQKKRIARSARHRKNGSKSKRCVLSTDYMTDKQIRERNGPVMTYNLKKPMSWSDFKRMPDDLKRDYIQRLVDTFNVPIGTISVGLFEMSQHTLTNYLKYNKIRVSCDKWTSRRFFKNDEWLEWLDGVAVIDGVADEVTDEVHDNDVEKLVDPDLAPTEFVNAASPTLLTKNAHFTFEGEMNKLTLYKMIETLPDMFGKVRVFINVERLEGV